MTVVVYDAGALIAAERNDREFWADHKIRLTDGILPVVPAVVVAQVSRSPRQVQLGRLLRGCEVRVLDEAGAHRAGAALGRAGTSDVADAAVATVARNASSIVTSDRADIAHLLGAVGCASSIIDV